MTNRRYVNGGAIPKSVGAGRVLCHNHVQHTVDMPDSTDPSRKMMRQIAGSFHEYEKARLVAKLKAARDRKRAERGKVEGRKSWADHKDITPEQARELARKAHALEYQTKTHKRPLRKIAAELAKQGHVNRAGKVFSPSVIRSMLSAKL
jgi:DNA invertase Pin-like site-specific DNA recombinase